MIEDLDRDKIVEIIGETTSQDYKKLIAEQQRIQRRLDQEMKHEEKNIALIHALEDHLSRINDVVAKQNEVYGDFYDKFLESLEGSKDVDSMSLERLAEFRTLHVRMREEIERLSESYREDSDALGELRKKFREGGRAQGQILAGLSQDEIAEFEIREKALQSKIDGLKRTIDEKIDADRKRFQDIETTFGEGSYEANDARKFINDPEAQKKWLESINEIQGFILDKENDYESTLRRGNETLRKRNQILKDLKENWNVIWGFIKKSSDYWIRYNHQAISDSKRLGITHRETAQAYNSALMESSKRLSRSFGMSMDQVKKIQESYIATTGRASILTQRQMEDIAATSSLMGEQNVQNAIAAMDVIGAGSEQAMELMDKNYAKAVNTGLDTAKASETLVKNLSLANQLSFRNGVDGIMKMSIESQRIKLNLSEVAKVADKFSNIEDAIKGSAQLQMLGGAGAMYGGNPMQMMYEALSDPEALYERMKNMFGSQAVFDRNKGEATISPLQMQLIKEQAKALGISDQEAITTAKQQAKISAIDSDWRRLSRNTFNNASDEERARIENIAQYSKEKGWYVNYVDEKGEKQEASLSELDDKKMAAIMRDNIEPVEDIRGRVRQIAEILVSFKDRKQSLIDYFYTGGAQTVNGPMNFIDDQLTDGAQGKGLAGTITDIAGMPVLGLAGGIGLSIGYKYLKRQLSKRMGRLIENSIAEKSLNNAKPLSKPTTPPQNPPRTPNPNRPWVRGSRLGKVARVGGNLMSVAAGAYAAYEGWQEAEGRYNDENTYINNSRRRDRNINRKEELQRIAENKRTRERSGAIGEGVGVASGAIAGAAIGSIVPGLGTAVGAIVGGAVGAYYGGKAGKSIGRNIGGSFEDHTKDDLISKEIATIEKGSTEENIRKIILPIESIDYNVALIANQLGVISAMPSRDNVYLRAEAEGVIPYETVEPTYSGNNGGGSSNIGGDVNLNVNGSINLKLDNRSVGKIDSSELIKLIEHDTRVRNEIVNLILESNKRSGNGNKSNNETRSAREGKIGS